MVLYNTYDDELLVQLLKSDDRAAFTELYNRYWDKLFEVAYSRLAIGGLAEELVQDVFLYLWNSRSSIQLSGKLSSYLATAMKYKIIDAHVKNIHAKDYREYAARFLPTQSNNTEEWLGFQELKDQLEALVTNLPEKSRLTYQLSKEQGLSQKEIARKMNISEKAVERNLARAMKSLRVSLKHFLSLLYFFL